MQHDNKGGNGNIAVLQGDSANAAKYAALRMVASELQGLVLDAAGKNDVFVIKKKL